MYWEIIERPLGDKVKFKRSIRPAKQGNRVEPLRYRFHKTAQQKRIANLYRYRVTHGHAMIWPPLAGSHLYYDMVAIGGIK
jgi:hypothetical protein